MDQDEKLQARPIGGYLDALASSAPAPGGGSAAGVVGALAAALGEMVVNLTDDASPELIAGRDQLIALRASTIAFSAADELLYPAYLDASRLPRSTDDEKATRKAAMQEAIQEAAAVPMQLAEAAINILELLKPVIAEGNRNVVSDAEVAVILADACVATCLVNVRVNIRMIRDTETASNLTGHAHELEQRARKLTGDLQHALTERTA